MNKLYPILSDSLRQLLIDLNENEENPIATEILRVDSLVREVDFIDVYHCPELYKLLFAEIEASITGEVKMLSIRMSTDDFEVSFLPGDKEPEYSSNGIWSRKNRQTGKPGKIFQKLLTKKFKTVEWEIFVNRFKAQKCCSLFEIVEGKEIPYWYNEDNYYECNGTLGNSCMRYQECKSYFDVYVDNAKMLITRKNGKLTGRAIVWEIDGITLLDRIYTCYDYLTKCFIDYAKENGWWIRAYNSLLSNGDCQAWLTPDDDYSSYNYKGFSFTAPREYSEFPYMDSFRYYNENTNTFTTIYDDELATCDSTEGYYNSSTVYICPECGRRFYGYRDEVPEEMVWSDWGDTYYCEDCVWWCDTLSDYIPCSEPSEYVYRSKIFNDMLPKQYVEEIVINNPDGNEGVSDIVRINNQYWYASALKWNKEEQKYELQSNSN